jgi:ornithine--oxo-acid transaminase
MADEIQTGLGRTGDLFACDYDGIKPDVLIVGKALGGGFYPVSAVLASGELLLLFKPGDHGSTFGGNPLGAAVAIAAMDVIVDEHLAARARSSGSEIVKALQEMNAPIVREIRGRGLLIGVEVNAKARALSERLLQLGVVAKDTHENVIRIAPPLTIDGAAIDMLLAAFKKVLCTPPSTA